ncbi:MAG: hypothetical protein R2770_08795 [Acidimicrobiales bacterium]
MTVLGERMERLAAEATAGIELADPSSAVVIQPASGWGGLGRRSIVVFASVVVAAAAILGVWSRFGGDSVVVTGPAMRIADRPGVFTRPALASDSPDDATMDMLARSLAGLGIGRDALRAGPAVDGNRVFVAAVPSDVEFCVWVVRDADGSVSRSCFLFAELLATGLPLTITITDVNGQTLLVGVAPPDVVGVRVAGSETSFADGVFVAVGSGQEVELVRSHDRQAQLDGCDALAVLAGRWNRLSPVGDDEASEITDVLDRSGIDELAALSQLLKKLPTPWDPRQWAEEFDLTELNEAIPAATDACRGVEAPGWSVHYVPATWRSINHEVPEPEVDLAAFGELQELSEAEPELGRVVGHGVGPVFGGQISNAGPTIAWWQIQEDGGLASICLGAGERQITSTSCSSNLVLAEWLSVPGAGAVVVVGVVDGAAFATATHGDLTLVQAARGSYFVFALPDESQAAVVTQYSSTGDILTERSISPSPPG